MAQILQFSILPLACALYMLVAVWGGGGREVEVGGGGGGGRIGNLHLFLPVGIPISHLLFSSACRAPWDAEQPLPVGSIHVRKCG